MKALVFGGSGKIGSAVAWDLAHDKEVEAVGITGLDSSREMLKIAKRRNPELEFIQADMLSLNLRQKFDIITCLLSSIAYAKTYCGFRRALSSFFRHLNPGGVLIIEPFFSRETFQVSRPWASFVDLPDIKIARLNVSRKRSNLAILDFHFLVATKRGIEYFKDRHELGLFEVNRVLKIIRETGFRPLHLKSGLMPKIGLYLGLMV